MSLTVPNALATPKSVCSAGFVTNPLTMSCAEIFPSAQHVTIGISPFNSYFRTERIVELIDWAEEHFEQIDFFVPDEAAAYTLQASGYTESKAKKKAREQAKYVHNKIHSAIDEVGIDAHDRVWGLAECRESARYNDLRAEAAKRFDEDAELRTAIMTTSSWILAGKLPDGQLPSEEQVLLAVQYFLDELPLFIDSPGIFGVEQSCFVYHQRVEFLERLYSGQLPWGQAEGQGFLVVQPEDEADEVVL